MEPLSYQNYTKHNLIFWVHYVIYGICYKKLLDISFLTQPNPSNQTISSKHFDGNKH